MSANDNAMLPCPFCGCTSVETCCDDIDLEDANEVWVECDDCHARGPSAIVGCRDANDGDHIDLDREAIGLWNKRAGE